MTVAITKESRAKLTDSPVTFVHSSGLFRVPYAIKQGVYTAEQFAQLGVNISWVIRVVNGVQTIHTKGLGTNNFTIDTTCNQSIYLYCPGGAISITFETEELTLGARYDSPTWDESTMTWNENTESWEQQGTIWSKETKNVATLTLETK